MTLQEIVSRYGDVPLYFRSYNKYEFRFTGGAPDGTQIRVIYGGSPDVIYRFGVVVDQPIYLDPTKEPDREPLSILLQGPGDRWEEWVEKGGK